MASTINATTSSGIVATADNTGSLALQSAGTTIATISSTGVAVTGSVTTNGVVGSPYTMKNRIINGGMVIDQRNAGAAISTSNTGGNYTIDRWYYYATTGSKFTMQQNQGSVTPPAGFSNYIGITSSSAYTPTGSDNFFIAQQIEANNISDLSWGTANAKTITISFWVRSSLTGNFGLVVENAPTYNYSYPILYTISSANTWEQKTITIPAPTAGTWATSGTGAGLILIFSIGIGTTYAGTSGAWTASNANGVTGQTNVVATNGATFYITGVQLEAGSSATQFEWRPYGTELALCQRYYWSTNAAANYNSFFRANGIGYSTTQVGFIVQLPVPMRASQSSVSYSGTIKTSDTVNVTAITSLVINQTNFDSPLLFATVASGITQFRPYILFAGGDSTSSVGISAEL